MCITASKDFPLCAVDMPEILLMSQSIVTVQNEVLVFLVLIEQVLEKDLNETF